MTHPWVHRQARGIAGRHADETMVMIGTMSCPLPAGGSTEES
jgi:hypothetical protein